MNIAHRLRIALLYDDTLDRPGGVGSYVLTLGAALVRRGHHVEYLLGNSHRSHVDGAPAHSLAWNVPVRFNGNALSVPGWSSGRRLDQVLGRGIFDVLHVQAPYSPLMAGRLINRAGPRCAVVSTYHVASDRVMPKLGARALAVLCRRSNARIDNTIGVSDTAAKFAARWSGVDAEHLIPNPVDYSRARRLASTSVSAPRAEIVVVARLVPRKGVAHLLNALAMLRRDYAMSPTLAIVGDGPLRARLEHRARVLGLTESVSFRGVLSDAAKFALLRHAKIACFPSLYGESFGVVIPEALGAGAQVILAGDNDGYRELLSDDDSLIDPRDTVAFAGRLAQLLRDGGRRRRLGDAQREMLIGCGDDHVCDAVLDLYEGALRKRRAQSSTLIPDGGLCATS